MTEVLELRGWRIEYDREATAAAHAGAAATGPESCGCDPCRNWAATRLRLLPEEFLRLLDRLGIPFDREVEVYHNCRLESGLHSYGAWYHFVGRVLSGQHDGAPNLVFAPFSLFFHSKPALVSDAFAGKPVVQLEVAAEVPWLSDLAEAS